MPKQHMQATWVQSVKPGSTGRTDYFDLHTTGLGLRVSPERKSWFIFYRPPGWKSMRRLTIGTWPAMSLGEAREVATEKLLQAKRGTDPAEKHREERSAPSFATLAAEYLERHAKPRKDTWRKDEQILNKDLLPRWKHRKAREISRRDVVLLLDEIVDRGAPVQANRTLAIIKKMFNFGITRSIVENNPAHLVAMPTAENPSERVLSDEEIKKLWAAFEELDPLVAATFRLRLLTGQRGGEITKMRWQDLDLEGGWWTIPSKDAKNDRAHRVPLSRSAVAIVESMKANKLSGGEWVFGSRMKRGDHLSSIQSSLRKLRKVAGISFVAHDLRRTVATNLTRHGLADHELVGRILNHVKPGDVTAIYDRYRYDKEKRAALDGWEVELERILARESE